MNGTERETAQSTQRPSTATTEPPVLDYVGWFAGAAQRLLLQKADIRQYVSNHGRLSDFEVEMANWGLRFDGPDVSVLEGAKILFGICESFELLKFVGTPRGSGPAATRGVYRGPVRGAARDADQGAHDEPRLAALGRELAREFGRPR